MKRFTNEDVIKFVKTTTSTDQFSQNEYPRELVDRMECYTYQEWCKMMRVLNHFGDSELINRYFDFEAFLKHEWDFSKHNGTEDYYLVRRDNDQLHIMESADEVKTFVFTWIVMIPTH